MHIPDGYLGPQTYVPAYGVMLPLWALASAKLKKTLRTRQIPMLALGAAFSFVIMMFNIPILGKATGHATGAVLIAVLLGPWAAMVAVSLALVVQAFVFGDGGVTAIGANCLNMAVVMPFVGWGVYRLIAGSAPSTSPRHRFAGAAAGYVGLNAAALTTAIMFGIQPLIARDAAGHALYNPFSLHLAIPAMAIEHLLVFGWVEAIVTGLVISYIQRTDPSMILARSSTAGKPSSRRPLTTRLAAGLIALIVLSPLGLILPAKFMAGSAWGEWSAGELGKLSGYVPKGFSSLTDSWKAPMPGYALPGQQSAPTASQSATYILSGVIGVTILVVAVFVLRRVFSGKDADEYTP